MTALSLAIGGESPAAAQPQPPDAPPPVDDQAVARDLFRQGLALVDQSDWEQAADRFERVLAIRWSAKAAYNLASALTHVGQLTRAEDLLDQVRNDAEADAAVRRAAQALMRSLARRMPRLRVRLLGDATGVDVLLDGSLVPGALVGAPLPVDPGVHIVKATRGPDVLNWKEVLADEGDQLDVDLQLPPRRPLQAETGAGHRPDASTAARPAWKQWWFWTGVGVVGLGLVVAGAVATAP